MLANISSLHSLSDYGKLFFCIHSSDCLCFANHLFGYLIVLLSQVYPYIDLETPKESLLHPLIRFSLLFLSLVYDVVFRFDFQLIRRPYSIYLPLLVSFVKI